MSDLYCLRVIHSYCLLFAHYVNPFAAYRGEADMDDWLFTGVTIAQFVPRLFIRFISRSQSTQN